MERHEFGWAGSKKQCDNPNPHPPHVGRSYETVCNGTGYVFCPGVEGQTEKGNLHIVIERRRKGGPDYFASIGGYWYLD